MQARRSPPHELSFRMCRKYLKSESVMVVRLKMKLARVHEAQGIMGRREFSDLSHHSSIALSRETSLRWTRVCTTTVFVLFITFNLSLPYHSFPRWSGALGFSRRVYLSRLSFSNNTPRLGIIKSDVGFEQPRHDHQ